MGVYISNFRLPSEYQEVEYIESSGSQYINTGKTVSGDVKIDYTYMPKEAVSSSTSGGILVFMDNDRRSNGFGSGNTYLYYGGYTSNNEGYTVGLLQQDVLCHDIISKSGCSRTINGNTVSYVPQSSYPSPTGNLLLFVSQRAGSIFGYWKTRMYSFKRYDSGVLTQDMIPCYRKSDNVIGLYDLVNSVFYTNSGTGTFSKGNDVTMVEMKNAYIGEVWLPTSDTLFYLNLDQTNGVFTDAMGHTTANNGVVYNSDGVIGGCGANLTTNNYCVQSEFNSGESFPSSFTIMAFIKFTNTGNHKIGVGIGDKSNKRAFYVGLQSDNVVEFCYMKMGVGWYPQTVTLSTAKNNWHHYAITYDGSTMIGYIDGEQQFTYSISGAGNATEVFTGFSVLGGKTNQGNYVNQIQGYVDEAICEKRVRTATDLQEYLSLVNY